MKVVTIYVYLPQEAVDCWVPVRAVPVISNDVFRILDEAPADPVWQFGKNDLVRCRVQKLVDGVTPVDRLVAFEKVEEPPPDMVRFR
jgi:hypothetical protein